MPPDGNFEDYVVLTQDTLGHRGAEVKIGGATVSTVHLALSNSAGQLDLQAIPTGNGTVQFPTSGGTLLTNVNFSAGTTSSNVSAVTFSNANNVSFGFDGTNITATATVASTQDNINISAGTTSNNLSAVTFSNSNGVSFGLNASTVTASVATSLTNVNISAGTTSNNLSAVTFSNANGVSFGLNASTVTASVIGGTAGGVTGLGLWHQGAPVTSFTVANKSLLLQPLLVAQNITAVTLLSMASVSLLTTAGGGGTVTVSAGLYTNNASTLSLASSVSSSIVLSTGATGASQSGIQYISMSVTSWSLTPGQYVIGFISTGNPSNNFTFSWYGTASGAVFQSQTGATASNGLAGNLTQYILPGYSTSTTAAFPSSIAQSDTNYVRDGRATSPLLQPGVTFLGT